MTGGIRLSGTEFLEAVVDPAGGEFFLEGILGEAVAQAGEVDLVEG